MKSILCALSLSLLSFTTLASSTESFIKGLQKDLLFTKTQRAIDLAYHIRVSEFGPLGKILSPDADAIYNGNLNSIGLSKDYLWKVQGKTQIKDARIIRKPDFTGSWSVSTIFHEMGHAELDVFIENKREVEDLSLNYVYQNILKPFYKKNFTQNPHTIFHEHFGYYRSDLIDFFYNELDIVFMSNGYNKNKFACFLTKPLREELKRGIPLEEFTKFRTIKNQENDFYRLKISPRYVFVRGKDLDLSKGDQKVIAQANLHFWSYHQEFYGFPINQKQFVQRLNQSSYQKKFAECRTKLWLENQKTR